MPTMTPEEWAAARAEIGIAWGPDFPADPFGAAADRDWWQRDRLATLVDTDHRTLERWERPGGIGPHPSAVRLVEWGRAGFWPPGTLVPPPAWDADDLVDARTRLGLGVEAAADLVGVEPRIFSVWETVRGPHPSATAILYWLAEGCAFPAAASSVAARA